MNCPVCKLLFPPTETKCHRCGGKLTGEAITIKHVPQRCIVCDLAVIRGDYDLVCPECKVKARFAKSKTKKKRSIR